jgi:hypothetical protein
MEKRSNEEKGESKMLIRSDYVITEDNVERRVTFEKVMKILEFLRPHTAGQLEQEMRVDKKPFSYQWGGKNITIEYRMNQPPAEMFHRIFGDHPGLKEH